MEGGESALWAWISRRAARRWCLSRDLKNESHQANRAGEGRRGLAQRRGRSSVRPRKEGSRLRAVAVMGEEQSQALEEWLQEPRLACVLMGGAESWGELGWWTSWRWAGGWHHLWRSHGGAQESVLGEIWYLYEDDTVGVDEQEGEEWLPRSRPLLGTGRLTGAGGCGKGEQVKPLCPARQNKNERMLC